jgi:hypothetical protein
MKKNTRLYLVVDARQLPPRMRGTMAAPASRRRRQVPLTGGVMAAGRGGGRKQESSGFRWLCRCGFD